MILTLLCLFEVLLLGCLRFALVVLLMLDCFDLAWDLCFTGGPDSGCVLVALVCCLIVRRLCFVFGGFVCLLCVVYFVCL